MEHDSRNIQMGQWALQRGWLSRDQCRVFLDEATAAGRSIVEIAVARSALNNQQAGALLQHSGWSQSDIIAVVQSSSGSGSQSGSRSSRTPTSSFGKATERLPDIGDWVDDYEILALLGKGGMGAVFKARSKSGSLFALKFILQGSEKAMKRFEREAHAVAAVDSHPNIVSIHKLARHGNYSYLVLDFVEGQSMDKLLEKGQHEHSERALVWIGKIAAALRTCHSRGVTHRDIKPANILIRDDDGEPMLMDFGLAKMSDGQQLTQSTEVLGTPHYMAPEQAGTEKDRIGPGSDIWALGVILYEACTGKRPFDGNTVVELATSIMFAQPEAPRSLNPDLSLDVETIILKCLEKEVEDRYESCAVLSSDCLSASRSEAISASRPGMKGAVARRWVQRHQKSVSVFLVLSALILSVTFVLKDVLEVGDKKSQEWSEDVTARLEAVKSDYQSLQKAELRHLEFHLWSIIEKKAERGPECKLVTSFQRSLDELETALEQAESQEDRERIVPAKLWKKLASERQFLKSLESGDFEVSTEFERKRSFLLALQKMKASDWGEAERAFEKSADKDRSLRAVIQLGRALIAMQRQRWAELEDALVTIPEDAGFRRDSAGLKTLALEERVLAILFKRELLKKPALIARLRERFQKSPGNAESAWLAWNEKVQGRFDLGAKYPGGLTALAKIYESLKGLRSIFPELARPRLSTELQTRLAQRAQRAGRVSEALFHYLELKRRDPNFKAPQGFQSGELDSLMLNSMAGGGLTGMKEAYKILLAASRAGWYLSALPEDYLGRLNKNGFLNSFIDANPGDPCARFWRGVIPVDFSLKKSGQLDKLNSMIDSRIQDLDFALSKKSFRGSLRAQALYQKAWLIRERPRQETKAARKKEAIRILSEALKHFPAKPDEFLLRLAGWLPSSERRLKLRYLNQSERIMVDRFKRTIDGRLNEDRPPQYGLHPIFAELEASRRVQIYNHRASIYRGLGDFKKSREQAQASRAVKENANAYIEMGRTDLAEGKVESAKKQLKAGKKLFSSGMWKLREDIENYERSQK